MTRIKDYGLRHTVLKPRGPRAAAACKEILSFTRAQDVQAPLTRVSGLRPCGNLAWELVLSTLKGAALA